MDYMEAVDYSVLKATPLAVSGDEVEPIISNTSTP